jgi:hypothetical protein
MSRGRATAEQLAAVGRFAKAYGHGRRWKAALLACWERSTYPGATDDDAAILQGVRNQLGPAWLAGVRLGDLAKKATTTVWLKLEIEAADSDDAYAVVDELLDQGILQDLINSHEMEGYGKLLVTSAIAGGPGDMRREMERS